MDNHKRSMLKSAIWRVLGVLILGTVTYGFTGSWAQTTAITFIHHAVFLMVYYLHERAWLKARGKLLRWKWWIRPITYEIILGHLILGLISLAVTGSWAQVTLITIVYIENKLWIYMVYDWIWKKIGG